MIGDLLFGCATHSNTLANDPWRRNRQPSRVPNFVLSGRDLEVLQISLLGQFIYLIVTPSAKHEDRRPPFARTKHCPIGLRGICELAADNVLWVVCIRRLWNRASPALKRGAHPGWQTGKCAWLEPRGCSVRAKPIGPDELRPDR
jgi:hypothetical protein